MKRQYSFVALMIPWLAVAFLMGMQFGNFKKAAAKPCQPTGMTAQQAVQASALLGPDFPACDTNGMANFGLITERESTDDDSRIRFAIEWDPARKQIVYYEDRLPLLNEDDVRNLFSFFVAGGR